MVPVITWLNPLVRDSCAWAWEEPSYRELLDYTRKYADVFYNYDGYCPDLFPDDLDKKNRRFKNKQGHEFWEVEIETPKGPLTSQYQVKHAGATLKFWVESEEDLEKLLSIPWKLSKRDFSEFFENKKILGQRGAISVVLADPICGIEAIKPELRAVWSIEKRSLIRNLVDIVFDRQMEHLEYLLKNIGSTETVFYFNGPEYALPPLMSPKDFDEFVMAYDPKLIERVHDFGGLTIVHSHGKVNNFLEKFRDMGTDGLNVLEPPPMGDVILSDAKKRIGKEVCLIGNIEYSDLATLSKEEIREKVKTCIRDAGVGGGFILSPSASCYEIPFPQKTSDNFLTMIKAGRKYGVYPLKF